MPKTIKNAYDNALTYSNLKYAYLQAKRGKISKRNVILFSLKYESIINEILSSLERCTYKFGSYKLFYIYEPKERKILATNFRDRVVHTWYVNSFILPYFVPSFINTTYACIKGRGMHKCALDTQRGMKKASKEYSNPYVVKLDIKKYFQNINRGILLNILMKKIRDGKLKKLTIDILNSSHKYDEVPGKSLPIGNYTSQMFANIYLNEVDQYIKHVLHVRYYYRYMHDMCIICENKKIAKEIFAKVEKFLNERLSLELNSKSNIFKLKQGVNFCGYKISINDMKIRDKGKVRLKKKIKHIKKSIKDGTMGIEEYKKYLAGHIGYIKHANINSLMDKLFYCKKI